MHLTTLLTPLLALGHLALTEPIPAPKHLSNNDPLTNGNPPPSRILKRSTPTYHTACKAGELGYRRCGPQNHWLVNAFQTRMHHLKPGSQR